MSVMALHTLPPPPSLTSSPEEPQEPRSQVLCGLPGSFLFLVSPADWKLRENRAGLCLVICSIPSSLLGA